MQHDRYFGRQVVIQCGLRLLLFGLHTNFVTLDLDCRPISARPDNTTDADEPHGTVPIEFGGPIHRNLDFAPDGKLVLGRECDPARTEVQRGATASYAFTAAQDSVKNGLPDRESALL